MLANPFVAHPCHESRHWQNALMFWLFVVEPNALVLTHVDLVNVGMHVILLLNHLVELGCKILAATKTFDRLAAWNKVFPVLALSLCSHVVHAPQCVIQDLLGRQRPDVVNNLCVPAYCRHWVMLTLSINVVPFCCIEQTLIGML